MIDAALCRGVINRRINRICQMFKWGVENELVGRLATNQMGWLNNPVQEFSE